MTCQNCNDTKKVKEIISIRRGIIEEREVDCPVCKEKEKEEEKKENEQNQNK